MNVESEPVTVHARLFVSLLASVSLLGCAKGCRGERPYTPYTVEADEPLALPAHAEEGEAPPAPSAALPVVDGARGVARKAPSEEMTSWSLDGLELVAPVGEKFIVGLAADLDADGRKDAVAWVSPRSNGDAPGSAGARGERLGRLVFYRGDAEGQLAPPQQVAELAGLFPAGCDAEVALEQVGRTTVLVKADARCQEAPSAGDTSRWMAIVSPLEEPALRQTLSFRELPEGERLSVTVDASDRDGDGRDDLSLRFVLEGAPPLFEAGPSMTAELRWFERTAGLSRAADEPEASLRPQATRQMVRAQRKKEAGDIAASTRQLMRLYTALCEEGGMPLVSFETGPLRCGTSRAVEDAVLAQIRAQSTLGEPISALAAWKRFSQWPTAHTSGRRKEAERIVRKLIPASVAGPSRVLGVRPVASSPPSRSPLSFDSEGNLLVLTNHGVVKATPHGEEWFSEETEPWPLAITSPHGHYRWASTLDACDGLSYRARFLGGEEQGFGVNELVLPILPPLNQKERCSRQAKVVPISSSGNRLEAMIADELWLIEDSGEKLVAKPLADASLSHHPGKPGEAKSPDGGAIAIGTAEGVLIRAESKWRLWRIEAGGDGPLEACAVANGAEAVACLRGGKVVIASAPTVGGK